MKAQLERLAAVFSDDVRRVFVLLAVCLVSALLIVDYARVPSEELAVGDVAPQTVEAPFTFPFQDVAERERRQKEARAQVPWVFVYRADLVEQVQARVSEAYAVGRASLGDVEGEEAPARITDPMLDAFQAALGASVPRPVLLPLFREGLPDAAEQLSRDLIAHAMEGPILADRELLPPGNGPLTLIVVRGAERSERVVSDHAAIGSPATARERLSLGLLDRAVDKAPWVEAAVSIARASLRPNLDYDHLETEERRERAAAALPLAPLMVKRGTTLFRQGDVLTAFDLARYRALQDSREDRSIGFKVLAVGLFLVMLLASLYHFGATYLAGFSTRLRDLAAAGAILGLTVALARLLVVVAPVLAQSLGAQADASTVWFALPVAGSAMLVRLLLGVPWALVFSLAASAMAGLVMDLDALYVVYFLLAAVVGAGAVEHTRERLAVVRAGLFTGLVSAVTVLLIHFLQMFLAEGALTTAAAMRPVWGMTFAFVGGLGSAFMVLALLPLFEQVGFVTDYRLMELANLNHPLMRQLMLRAPGSYHHSVVVGSLSEAACEAVGANALQARVAAYFHDIGKANKPQYFVENQRGGVNRHDRLDPYTSAQVIINHVVDGGRMARQHGLPKPIVDNIYMHHGTGLLQFFYAKAISEADDPSEVSEVAFRYPGPLPNTREAGIIMLADKVEAATRTIRQPTEENIRAMIMAIINSVMADGQFEDCPLTFREIYTIADTFVAVLVGIHHQRIEYPQTAELSGGTSTPAPARSSSVITLEIPAHVARAVTRQPEDGALADDVTDDYEAVENLPHGK